MRCAKLSNCWRQKGSHEQVAPFHSLDPEGAPTYSENSKTSLLRNLTQGTVGALFRSQSDTDVVLYQVEFIRLLDLPHSPPQ